MFAIIISAARPADRRGLISVRQTPAISLWATKRELSFWEKKYTGYKRIWYEGLEKRKNKSSLSYSIEKMYVVKVTFKATIVENNVF